jgi:HK97 family phage prohead protease
MPITENRAFNVAVRAINKNGVRTLTGVIPFNSRSELISEKGRRFVEQVAPGAFNFAHDTRALINHASYPVLGRTSNGNLRIKQTAAGLEVECDLPDTQSANDLYTSVERQDINGISFNFDLDPAQLKDSWDYKQTPPVRTLLSIQSDEISFVGQPAYAGSTVVARNLDDAADTGWAEAMRFGMEVLAEQCAASGDMSPKLAIAGF